MPHSNKKATKRTSLAKAAGLKSAFVVSDNELLITSFGKGNIANMEYTITKTDKNTLNKKPYEIESEINNSDNFNDEADVKSDNHNISLNDWIDENKKEYNDIINIRQFSIESKRTKAEGNTINPIFSNKDETRHMDQIGLRDKLEEYYFGGTFDDNIHIQIAYCIRDIEKLLTLYVNNIVNSLNNLIPNGNNNKDIIGSFRYEKPYFKLDTMQEVKGQFNQLLKKIEYFGLKIKDDKDDSNTNKDLFAINKKELYYLFAANSFIRQFVVHPKLNLYGFFGNDVVDEGDNNEITNQKEKLDWAEEKIFNSDTIENFVEYIYNHLNGNIGNAQNPFLDELIRKFKDATKDIISRIPLDECINKSIKNVTSKTIEIYGAISEKSYDELSNIATINNDIVFSEGKDNVKIINTLNEKNKNNYIRTLFNEAVKPVEKYVANIETIDSLNKLYNRRIENINEGFAANASRNLALIFKVYDVCEDNFEEKESIIRDYYDFIIYKKYKKIGFSIKKLRESLIKLYDEKSDNDIISDEKSDNDIISDKKYDDVRSIINVIIDFILYRNYNCEEKEKEISDIIDRLRVASAGDCNTNRDDKKNEVYIDIAGEILGDFKDKLDTLLIKVEFFLDEQKNTIKELIKDESSDVLDVIYEEFNIKNEEYIKKENSDLKDIKNIRKEIMKKSNEIKELVNAYPKLKTNIERIIEFKLYYDYYKEKEDNKNVCDKIKDEIEKITNKEIDSYYENIAEDNNIANYIVILNNRNNENFDSNIYVTQYYVNKQFDFFEKIKKYNEKDYVNPEKLVNILSKKMSRNMSDKENQLIKFKVFYDFQVLSYDFIKKYKKNYDEYKKNNKIDEFYKDLSNQYWDKVLKHSEFYEFYKKLSDSNQNDFKKCKYLVAKEHLNQLMDRENNEVKWLNVEKLIETETINDKIKDLNDDEKDLLKSKLCFYFNTLVKKNEHNKYEDWTKYYCKEIKDILNKKYNYFYEEKINVESYRNTINDVISQHYVDSSLIDIDNIKSSDKNIDNNKAYNYFCKFIYSMTFFLDGKEINELLTGLINDFDNIASLLDILKNIPGAKISINDNYRMFKDSHEIVNELSFINSFARMGKGRISNERTIQEDALKILGCNDNNKINEIIGEPEGEVNSQIRSNINFIKNNIIKSQRFAYLIKYANAGIINNLLKNKSIVNLVIDDIPDAQIERYYRSYITTNNDNSSEENNELVMPEAEIQRKELKDVLTNFDYKHIFKTNDSQENEVYEIGKSRSIVRLYLTVLYIAVKNMVHINSRYFMAFYAHEKDNFIKDSKKYNEKMFYKTTYDYLKFNNNLKANNNRYLNELKATFCRRLGGIIDDNANDDEKADDLIIHEFRNNVEHLGCVRKMGSDEFDIENTQNENVLFRDVSFRSWFEIYHYTLQILMFKKISRSNTASGVLENQKRLANKYLNGIADNASQESNKKYSKNALKAMCLPFAYNLPRYKNLTTERLFDMNR